MDAAVALALLIALIPGCLGQFLSLCLQKLVECFLYASTHKFLELPLDNFLVLQYNLLRHGLLPPFEWCVATSFYRRSANLVFYFCETYSTLSQIQN